MHYTALTQDERYHISGLLKAHYTQAKIAHELNRSSSTISRELSRNTGKKGYRPKQAQRLADERRHQAAKALKWTVEVERQVVYYLKQKWSPEQISHRLKQDKKIRISHERIYQFILQDKQSGGELYKHLRHSHKKRKKRYGHADRRGIIKNRVSIEKRPKIVAHRKRIGDWEGDTVIGKNHQGALVTLVDRLSLKTFIKRVPNKQANEVSAACLKCLWPYRKVTHTITLDNGKEFAGHETIAAKLKADIYFAHPYSSWERGTNENTNGLIRQYVPKGSSFENLTDQAIQRIEDALNNRPRKCLGWLTPNEIFEQHLT